LFSRFALVVGILNLGYNFFSKEFLKSCPWQPTMLRITWNIETREKNVKETINKELMLKWIEVKTKKSREEVFRERTNTSYGPGVGLMAGMVRTETKRKQKESVADDPITKKSKICKCGSSSHLRTTHRDCPLKKNAPLTVPAAQMAPLTITPLHSSTLMIIQVPAWLPRTSIHQQITTITPLCPPSTAPGLQKKTSCQELEWLPPNHLWPHTKWWRPNHRQQIKGRQGLRHQLCLHWAPSPQQHSGSMTMVPSWQRRMKGHGLDQESRLRLNWSSH